MLLGSRSFYAALVYIPDAGPISILNRRREGAKNPPAGAYLRYVCFVIGTEVFGHGGEPPQALLPARVWQRSSGQAAERQARKIIHEARRLAGGGEGRGGAGEFSIRETARSAATGCSAGCEKGDGCLRSALAAGPPDTWYSMG